MTNTITLTIGHNVAGVDMLTHAEIIDAAADYLHLEGFTAYECTGYWLGELEKSTRIEACGLDADELERIEAEVPTLATALNQQAIMCEARPDRVEFIERYTIAAAIA